MSVTSTLCAPNSFELPYGYQIDLDFIKYCESIAKPILTDNGRRQQRRQRHSLEVMLGLEQSFNSVIDNMKRLDVVCDTSEPPTPPPRSHRPMININPKSRASTEQSDLDEAVNDFEKTFEISHCQKSQRSLDILNNDDYCITTSHTNSKTSQLPETSSFNYGSTNFDKRDISKILVQIEDLEEKTKLIPLLQLQVQKMKSERDHFQQMLEKVSTCQQAQKQNISAAFQPQRISPVALNPFKFTNSISKRTVGTNTAVTSRREVGCSPVSSFTKTNRSIMTDLSLEFSHEYSDKLYTEKDLRGEIEKDRSKMRKITTSVAVQSDCIATIPNSKELKTKNIRLNRSDLKAVSIPPTLSDNVQVQGSSSLSLSSLLSPSKSTQNSIKSIDKSTDSFDLQKPKVNKQSHTSDLIRCAQIGVNTESVSAIPLRSSSTNTSTIVLKSVGTATDDDLIEDLLAERIKKNINIPIRNQTVLENRNFKRQDTFTISTKTLTAHNIEKDTECPAEKLLRLTMTSSTDQDDSPPSTNYEETENSKNHANSSKTNDVDNNDEASGEVVDRDSEHEKSACGILVTKRPADTLLDGNKDGEIYDCEHESAFFSGKYSSDYGGEEDDEDEDEDEDEDDDEEEDKFFDDDTQFVTSVRPPPTSISTIRLCQQNRPRIKPTKEMISALKVINDTLKKGNYTESELKNAREIAACEWFQISSTKDSQSNNVEDYLDFFEEQSWDLLNYMVGLTDKNGNTALHYAVSHRNFDVVSILLDSKVCDVNKTNNAGYTCVMLVSLAKELIPEHQTVVRRLFKLADVNIRASKNQQTALMLSVSHGNFLITTLLVEASADINIQDDDGSTALMCAAEHGFEDIVKFLLAQPECDSTKQDVDGNTALKIALESGYHDTGCLLYAHEHILRQNKTSLRRTSSIKSSTGSINENLRK